jgi:hypothetical protein
VAHWSYADLPRIFRRDTTAQSLVVRTVGGLKASLPRRTRRCYSSSRLWIGTTPRPGSSRAAARAPSSTMACNTAKARSLGQLLGRACVRRQERSGICGRSNSPETGADALDADFDVRRFCTVHPANRPTCYVIDDPAIARGWRAPVLKPCAGDPGTSRRPRCPTHNPARTPV